MAGLRGLAPWLPAALAIVVARVLLCGESNRRRFDPGMSPAIRPGAVVLVRWASVPHASPCHLHLDRDSRLFKQVGVVDRFDERWGDDCVVLVFGGIRCSPFGSTWVDAFTPDELVLIA